jgi:prepilin-type N-terminal cleavage/methylation domain-containing protein
MTGRTRGFTLIGLLVVIAIIAIFMAIVMPALHTAKKIATSAVCLGNPASWTFYDPLASYHNKSSMFGFADVHAERIKWMDKRTLQFIEDNAADPSAHSGFNRTSPDNEDLQWLLEHFIGRERIE